MQIRLMDVQSRSYEVAYEYMIRLKEEDFTPKNLPGLAKAARMSEQEFKERFGQLLNPITGEPLAKQ